MGWGEAKIIILLEKKNPGENLCDLALGDGCLDQTPKPQMTKENIRLY
jgi:hypothetical protein